MQNNRDSKSRLDRIPSYKPNSSLHCMETRSIQQPGDRLNATTVAQKFLYGFLPFYFITRVLHKVMFDQTKNVVLLTPTWHIQAWYSQLLLMLIDQTILLPKQRNILKDPSGKEHPLVIKNSMRLVGSKISGRSYLCHKFQKQLITGARRASFKANYESVWRKRID